MKKDRNATLIAFCLMFALAFSFFALPAAHAQGSMSTYPFIGAVPNPAGVGQEVLLHVGITLQLQSEYMGWEGLTVTITRPDGTTQTLTDIRTDSTGGTGVVYVPTMAGNYTLQTHFPEQTTTSTKRGGGVPVGAVMRASDSAKLVLVVTEQPAPDYPGVPLPTEYWIRPINAQAREWAAIAGSWPGVPENRFVQYNDDAPESAHVLWTKPVSIGGLIGGGFEGLGGSPAFENGAAYEQKFGAPAILGGILYYNRYPENGGTNVEQEVVAVDLHTGKELWVRNWNNSRLDVGQIFYWQSFNYMGGYAILWEVTGTTWKAFEAFTGRWMYTMTNVPATISSYGGGLGGNSFFGPRGEILAYTANLNNGWMTLWNSSRVVSDSGSFRAQGNTYNCSWTSARKGGYEWNKTIPKGLPGSIHGVELGQRVVGSSVNLTDVVVWAFSLEPGQEGQLLFKQNWKAPSDWASGNQTISWSVTSLDDNVGIVWSKETFQWWGFSLETGQYLWGPTAPENYLETYGTSTAVAYGKFFSCYMSGIVTCYDIKAGTLLWKYYIADPYNENLWSPNWPCRVQYVADGKLYLCEGEHSPNQPLPRGAPMICLDVETGEKIWSLNVNYYYRTNTLMADNVIAMMDSYDQRIYAIGKGPSATSVIIRNDVTTLGNSVLIQGAVTDVSPGTSEYALTARFPNGVPAVSDENMGEWMQYVHMQFARPTNVKGVEVTLSVLDSNNNYREIGKTNADSDGFFSFKWTPDIEGKYTVTVTFEGSKSYYPSHATTAFIVDPAPSVETGTDTGNVATLPPIEAYLVGVTVAIILAIAIVGFLLLRKRP